MSSFDVDVDSLVTVAAGVLDAHGVLIQANAGLLRLLPPQPAQPIGTTVTAFFIQPSFAELVAGVDVDGSPTYHGLMTVGDRAGKTRSLRGRVWRTATGIRVLAEHDVAELERIFDAMLDLNRESSTAQHTLARSNLTLKQREVQFVEASLTDALTGVGNRRKLDQVLSSEISRCERHGGTLCAIMADIDHFKRVNDEHGHGVGDEVLVHFGTLLRAQTRQTDTVARFGGEEFIVLMPHTILADALSKAELIRGALEAQHIEPLSRPVTASFGAAELLRGEGSDGFLRRVDAALYAAKAAGRNAVVAAASA